MTATLLPNGEQQFIDENGKPYAGGSVYFYTPGTTTPKDTYQDANGTILNTNPVILDSAGRAIILGTGDYRQVLFDSALNMIWDQLTSAPLPDDAISAVMAPVVAASTLQQARDIMGVTSAIQSAITAASLVGPTGPQGPTGPAGTAGNNGATGPTGPTGPAATGGGSVFVQSRFAVTDSIGQLSVTFPTPFPSTVTVVQVLAIPNVFDPAYVPVAAFGMTAPVTTTGFQCLVYDNTNTGIPNATVSYYAIGY